MKTGNQQYECFFTLLPFVIYTTLNVLQVIKLPVVENAKEL